MHNESISFNKTASDNMTVSINVVPINKTSSADNKTAAAGDAKGGK